jgi:hypothetical protein
MQEEWARIEFPHGKGSKPRDPTHYIKDLKMEELSDLLWLGGVLAKNGTSAWCRAWHHLRQACVHYLFGYDATEQETRTASNELRAYAELMEKHVQSNEVSNREPTHIHTTHT